MRLFKRCSCPIACKHPFSYEFEINGQRFRKSTKTANRQTAERLMERRRIAILEGRDKEPQRTYMLSEHIDDYVKYKQTASCIAHKDRLALDRFLKSVGNRPLADVAPFAIERWKIQRSEVVKKSTVNRELISVRGCFTMAVKWGRIDKTPLPDVRDFSVDDRRIRTFDDDELKRILAFDDPIILLCRTTLECLPRISEVLAIRREHIGPTWIEFRRKGGMVSRAAVTESLRADLLARCHPLSGFVFGERERGLPPPQQTASGRVVQALRALGITNASHHTFRHTGVTMMLEAGRNPRVIQQLAGWTSLQMLQRYGHVRDTEMRAAVEGNAARLAAL